MTNTLIAKLYLAINENATASQIDAAILDDSAEAAIVALSPEAFLEASYQAAFGRSVDAEGSAYYLPKLEDGTISQDDFAAILVAGADAYPADGIAADLAATDAEIAANKVAAEVIAESSGISAGNTASILATVETSTGGGVADEDEDETTDDDTGVADDDTMVILTELRDAVTTGSGDDTIYGDAGQNQNGAIANAFSTGDMIDGGAGSDTLITTIIGDNNVDGSNETLSINARVSNVEIAKFELIDQAVVVDAGKMDSVEEFWSVDSANGVTLTLEDVRLGDLAITKDITFGMKDVDFNSNLTVQFDSASLTNAGDSKSDSQVSIQLIDATALTVDAPVGNVSVTLGFDVAGDTYTLANVESTDGTYEGLKDAIATELAVKGLTDLTVTLGDSFTELTTGNNTTKTLTGVTAQEIIITDGSGDEFTNVTFTQAAVEAVPTGFTVAGVAASVDPQTSSALIETNLILDNAGRDSTAGNVVIGGMSNSDNGVEQVNISVDRDSAITSLNVGETKTQNIVITSLDAKGDLEIGNVAGWDTTKATTINASAFTGTNLMLGSTVEIDVATTTAIEGIAVSNLNTLSANIAANVTFLGSTTVATENDDNGVYAYTTGTGADKIQFTLDGDSVDASGESFALSTNSGADSITIAMDAAQTGVSQATMKLLSNLDIDSGSGADSITINSYGNFNIAAGADSDTVIIDSLNANGNATVIATTVGTATGSQTWGDTGRVLVDAKLTVNFAGIEETVTVVTSSANNFVATQETINDAIIAAIAASPELSKLVKATLVTGTEQLSITSLVGGENDIAIDLFQPQLISTGTATSVQTLITESDATALRAGLLATETVTTLSAELENAAEVVTWTDAAADFYGSIAQNNAGNKDLTGELSTNKGDEQITDLTASSYAYMSGVALGTDATTDVNFSTINLGDGANDLVVLHSNDLSMNTIVIDGSFGKDTVVNFFDNAPTDADQNKANVGLHQVDFTKILTNKVDTSTAVAGTANADSATSIAVNLHDAANTYTSGAITAAANNTAQANSVNVLHYNEAISTTSVKFDAFTADQLKSKLNDQAGTDTTVLGGLDHTSLTIAETGATLVGTTQNHIFMVENEANLGEYKVFSATSTLDATDKTKLANSDVDDFTTVVELGTLDFGHSINFNLASDPTAGATTASTMLANLIASVDDTTGATTVTVDGVTAAVTTTVSATAAATAGATNVNFTQTAVLGNVINALGNSVDATGITTVTTGSVMTATSSDLSGATITGAVTVSDTVAAATLATIAGNVTGVLSGTATTATAAILDASLTTATAADTIALTTSDTTVAASVIASLDTKTAGLVDATAATTAITGTADEVLVYATAESAGTAVAADAAYASTISDTTLDATTALAITVLEANTGSVMDISAATTINATTTEILDIVANTSAAYTTNAAAAYTIEGTDATAANYATITGDTTGNVTITVNLGDDDTDQALVIAELGHVTTIINMETGATDTLDINLTLNSQNDTGTVAYATGTTDGAIAVGTTVHELTGVTTDGTVGDLITKLGTAATNSTIDAADSFLIASYTTDGDAQLWYFLDADGADIATTELTLVGTIDTITADALVTADFV